MNKIQGTDHLASVVAASRSMSEVARTLGYKPAKGKKMPGGVYKFLKQKVREFELDTSHFCGQGWAKGKTRLTDTGIEKQAKSLEFSDAQAFCENSKVGNRPIYNRLVREGKEEKCDECGLRDWMGKPITIQLDHINGVNDDNRRNNLRFLCPNCHSQTLTHSRGSKYAAVAKLVEAQA